MSDSTTTVSISKDTLQKAVKALANLDYATRVEGDCLEGDNSLAVHNLLNGNYDRHVEWQAALNQAMDEVGPLPQHAPYKERRARVEWTVDHIISYYREYPELRG